jgi:hypothetical protein
MDFNNSVPKHFQKSDSSGFFQLDINKQLKITISMVILITIGVKIMMSNLVG